MLLFGLLELLIFTALAQANLNCTPLVPYYGFNNTSKAFLQLQPHRTIRNPDPPLPPGNAQVGYPITLAAPGQNGTLFSLQTCQSPHFKIGHQTGVLNNGTWTTIQDGVADNDGDTSCTTSHCYRYDNWFGARLVNPATGHCLTVRSLAAKYPRASDLYMKVCDRNPASLKVATQLFLVVQILTRDANGNLEGDTSVRIYPEGPAEWLVGADGDRTKVQISQGYSFPPGVADAVLLPAWEGGSVPVLDDDA